MDKLLNFKVMLIRNCEDINDISINVKHSKHLYTKPSIFLINSEDKV